MTKLFTSKQIQQNTTYLTPMFALTRFFAQIRIFLTPYAFFRTPLRTRTHFLTVLSDSIRENIRVYFVSYAFFQTSLRSRTHFLKVLTRTLIHKILRLIIDKRGIYWTSYHQSGTYVTDIITTICTCNLPPPSSVIFISTTTTLVGRYGIFMKKGGRGLNIEKRGPWAKIDKRIT